jgi:hypothetical protein
VEKLKGSAHKSFPSSPINPKNRKNRTHPGTKTSPAATIFGGVFFTICKGIFCCGNFAFLEGGPGGGGLPE